MNTYEQDHPDWMFIDDERLLANGWQSYAEFIIESGQVERHDVRSLMLLQMAFVTGIAHTLKVFQHKKVEPPLVGELWEQLVELKEIMMEAGDLMDQSGL